MDSEEEKELKNIVNKKKAEFEEVKEHIGKLKSNIPAEDPKFNDLRKRKAELTLELDDIEYQLRSGATAQMNEQLGTLERVAATLETEIGYLEKKISSD